MREKISNKKFKIFLEVLAVFTILALVLTGIYYLEPIITGFITVNKQFNYVDNIDVEINASSDYVWILENLGNLKSIKLSGTIGNKGSAKVYIENNDARYLIFDSNKLNETGILDQITGFVIAQDKNKAPVWNSSQDEFILNQTLILDLNNYFNDKDNDLLSYAASEFKTNDLEILLENSILIINNKNNVEGNITLEIIASDNETSKKKNVGLILIKKIVINKTPIINITPIINETIENITIINETKINITIINETINITLTNITNITINKSIKINFEYKSGTEYDVDDNGIETTTGIIDLTVESSKFNWDIDENKLCTRWETYSIDNEESTFVCYGNSDCCSLVNLVPTRVNWNDVFHTYYGLYGATFNNVISSQIIYADYNLSVDDPYAEIYYSNWENLSANYYSGLIAFNDICIDTCTLFDFDDTNYTLIIEINDTTLNLYEIDYIIEKEVLVNNPPILIKNISNITIIKNKNYSLDLNDYFYDQDNDKLIYDYFKDIENISVYIDGNFVTIVPDKGFTGTEFMFFKANDSFESIVSNVFSITITEKKIKDCSDFIRTDDGLYYCADDESFYSCKGFEEVEDLTRCTEAKFLRNTVSKNMCPFKHKDCNVTVNQDKGWGPRQAHEKENYKLSVFHENFHCGLGKCEVPFFFKSKTSLAGELDFDVTSDVDLRNISIKRVLKDGIEENVGTFVSMQQHDSYYYKAYFDYEVQYRGEIIKTGIPVKFNISVSLDGEKILELDPIADPTVSGGIDVDLDNAPSTITWTHACPAGGDPTSVMFVGVAFEDNVCVVSSIRYAAGAETGAGFDFDLVGSDTGNVQVRTYMYNLTNPTACDGNENTITVQTGSCANNDGGAGISMFYTGHDGIDLDNVQTNNGVGSAASFPSAFSVSNPDWVIDVIGVDVDPAADIAPDGDNSGRERGSQDTGGTTAESSDARGDGSVDMTWGGGFSDDWAIVGVPLIGVPDTTKPRMNASLDDSTPYQGQKVTMKANVTDEFELHTCRFYVNDTSDGSFIILDKSVSGKSDSCKQNFTIASALDSVLNFTVIVNDTSATTAGGNLNQTEQIITVSPLPNLFVNISSPDNTTQVTANDTFTLIANITCLNNDCGIVRGLARYNDSGSSVANTSIRARYLGETIFPTPLFINGSIDGEQFWSYLANLGGTDIARGVAVDSQDNIIVVGRANDDWNVTKLDSDGNQLWSYLKDFGGIDIAYGVATDSNDNIIVVGEAVGDWNVTKLDSDGNQIWSYLANLGGTDTARGVAVDSQDNIIVVGDVGVALLDDDWNVTKLDSDGNQLWSYTLSLPGTSTDEVQGVAVDSQDNIIVVGTVDSNTGNMISNDWNVTKLDSDGNQLWSYLADSGGTDIAEGVAVDSQDNIIVVGRANNDWNVTKLDSDGNQLWSYLADSGGLDIAEGVAVDSQDNIIVVGRANDDWNVTKLDSDGNQLWSYRYPLAGNLGDTANGVAIDLQDNIMVVGRVGAGVDWNVTKLFGSENPLSCGNMKQNDVCQLNWTINASGDIGTHLVIDVNFSSDNKDIQYNDTEDRLICIGVECPIEVPPAFSGREPANDSSTDNSFIQFNITITEVGGSNVNITQLWTNATDGIWALNQSDNWTDGGKHTFNVTDFNSNVEFIYWAVFANDSRGNFNFTQNFSFKPNQAAAADTTPPIINGTINNTSPKFGEVINASFNVTDLGGGLGLYGNITINISGSTSMNFNFTFTGTSGFMSQNITINATRGTVLNISGLVNDTSNNVGANSTLITVANTPPLNVTFTDLFNNIITNKQPLEFNVTFAKDVDGDIINITYYIDGKINQTQLGNTTYNASDGQYLLNVSLHNNLVPIEPGINSSLNFTIDTTRPVVNTSLNKSLTNIGFGDVINISANVTDGLELSFCQIIINQTGPNDLLITNVSVDGLRSGQCSNASTVILFANGVINYTIRVNDTAGNFRTNDTIITVVDDIVPIVNTSLNKSLTGIKIFDVINLTANVTDETGLSFGQIIVNDTGFVRIFNFSLSGTTDTFSQNITITDEFAVINFTARVNDTSNNFATNDTIVSVVHIANLTINLNITNANTDDDIYVSGHINLSKATALVSPIP